MSGSVHTVLLLGLERLYDHKTSCLGQIFFFPSRNLLLPVAIGMSVQPTSALLRPTTRPPVRIIFCGFPLAVLKWFRRRSNCCQTSENRPLAFLCWCSDRVHFASVPTE